MKNLVISTIGATLFMTFAASAQETPVDNVVTVAVEEEIVAPVTDHAGNFAEICEFANIGKIVLSDQAKEACLTGAMPTVIKDQTRFSSRGVGSEFNTLVRNFID